MQQSSVAEIPLLPRPPWCEVPLTTTQRLTWGSRPSDAPSPFTLCAVSDRVLGPFDVERMKSAVAALVIRHETLRTTFAGADGVSIQVVAPAGACPVQVVDLTNMPAHDAQERARHITQEMIAVERYLTRGPLFEVLILKLSSADHVLFATIDHMISDAVSCAILRRDLWALYDDCATDPRAMLPPLAIQFPDFAVWQKRVETPWLREHGPYWRERLSGSTALRFPRDPDGTIQSEAPARLFAPLGQRLSTALREYAAREQVPLPLVVLTICAVVLARWCEQSDYVLGPLSHGRRGRPELENMIGFLTHAPRMRISIASGDTFSDLVPRIQSEFATAHFHADCGLMPESLPGFDTHAAFNWISIWPRTAAYRTTLSAATRVQPFAMPDWPRQVDLCTFSPVFSDSPAGIVTTIRYRSDWFRAQTAERFARNLRSYALEFVQRPSARLAAAYFP